MNSSIIFLVLCVVSFSYGFVVRPEDKPFEQESGKLRVLYSVWAGKSSYSKFVTVRESSVFYDVMVAAAKEDKRFAFEYQTSDPWGRFITKIGGYSQDADANKYWLLYDMENYQINTKPGRDDMSDFGVDSLVVQNGHRYIFWLQNL